MSDSEDSGTPTAALQLSSSEDVKAIISENVDLLSEKRAATRCGALGKLRDVLCSRNCCDELENWKESLCASFISCFKTGSEEEQLLVLRCSTLLVFTLAPSGDELAERLEKSFQKLKSGISAAVAANVMLFRCSACWMHSDLRATTALMGEVLSHLIAQAENSSSDGECTAILSTCWCMLATTIPLSAAAASAPHAVHRLLPTLGSCSAVAARTSIANSIGFCFALCHRCAKEIDEHEPFAEISSLQDAAEATLQEGISESSKKRSKSDKKQQKAAYRIALAAVQGCEFDSERLIVTSSSGNAVADVNTWTMHAQVQALRVCLGHGFSSIIGGSEYLQSMLEMDLFDKGQDSRVRVRSNTKADKSRSSERKNDRLHCYRAGQHGGADDDDE